MEQIPTWEANSSSAREESPCLLCNQKIYYHIHMSPPPVPILIQINPVHASPFHFLNIHLNIILPSTPRSFKWSFTKRCAPPKPLMHLSCPHSCHILKAALYIIFIYIYVHPCFYVSVYNP